MCVRSNDFASVSTIFPLDLGNFPTVWYFMFSILLLPYLSQIFIIVKIVNFHILFKIAKN